MTRTKPLNPILLRSQPLAHQKAAIAKLKSLKVGGLFMEMGTGKTFTSILLASLRSHKITRVVYLCPVDLKTTIATELRKHIEQPQVYTFDEKTKQGQIPQADFYICGVESVGQSDRVTLALNDLVCDRTFVVLDESDTCKNHAAKRTMRLTQICQRAKYRLIMTGTAVGEGVEDLYAQLYFLSPQILGYKSFYSFAANHLEFSKEYPGMVVNNLRVDYITQRLEPYVYQVKKEECLDLPRQQYLTRAFDTTYEQRQLYWQAKHELLNTLTDDEIDSYTIFRLFTALREIVSGFWNQTPDPRIDWRNTPEGDYNSTFHTCPHDRVALLLSVLKELPQGEPVVIWANFNYAIEQIVDALQTKGIAIATYYGQTVDRDAELARWRSGKAQALIASPRCGGRGIDLTRARYAIFYNNDFPYRLRDQAEARIHRIGQERPVTYIDLVCRDTIDGRIVNALWAKENLAQRFKKELQGQQEKRQKLLQL